MGVLKVFERDGFKGLVVKSVAFVLVLVMMQVLCRPLDKIASIPHELKPFSFLQVGEALLFVLVLFIIYNREKLFDIAVYKVRKIDFLFVVLSFLMLVLNYLLRIDAVNNPVFWGGHVYAFIFLMSFLLFLMAVFLGLGIFGRKMVFDLFHEYKGQIKYLALVFFVYYFLFSFVQGLWPVFSGVVSYLAYSLFSLFYQNVSYSVDAVSGIPVLSVENFGAKIGAPCSGVESLLLFTALFMIIIAVDFKKINLKRALIAYVPAIVGVFILNVLRICLLFLVGLYISRDLAVGVFHANVGWIIFSSYFFVFLYFAYPWMVKRKGKKK